jgi:hypothetical protein
VITICDEYTSVAFGSPMGFCCWVSVFMISPVQEICHIATLMFQSCLDACPMQHDIQISPVQTYRLLYQ